MIQAKDYSDQGGREYNEDSCLLRWKDEFFCAAVADGLGGHGGGDVASSLAVRAVEAGFSGITEKRQMTKETLEKWFACATEAVLKQQTKICQMRTTLVVLCLADTQSEKKACWAHLGDSRLYHFVDGQQVFCTFDHSVSRMAVLAGEITMDDIRFHSDRNKLIKVIGKSKDTVPEYGECILKPGKHAFLLCTDGFWEYVTEKEMEKTLKKASSPEKWILAMRKILAGRVDGTQDNNSAIAVFVEEEKKWKGK
ncbi:MAG: protein phosphatase 2C domain-containing protein [Lachnospiraceae bacterium]|nr:protein phosphatase 2C domain-containing protein [Lachnospiraceae bacterium]